ncbi:cytochrome P450 2J6-like [Platysternon megacephalum]|uniref:Aspartate carbamoyltransferase n=1 Tax=Platysternon megacephalum TaxID=55544 RepID=A0A4D9EBQ0_9SAUR|nr:aspartate carbamoyltransferase [Platysternon megacephalum]TFK05815.1 cytochrome P450 2J6-like [Platysternon megacephalum]
MATPRALLPYHSGLAMPLNRPPYRHGITPGCHAATLPTPHPGVVSPPAGCATGNKPYWHSATRGWVCPLPPPPPGPSIAPRSAAAPSTISLRIGCTPRSLPPT